MTARSELDSGTAGRGAACLQRLAGLAALFCAAAVLLVIGALWMRPRLLAAFLLITIFYVTFVPGPISQIRFRLPVTPAILLLVAVGAQCGKTHS